MSLQRTRMNKLKIDNLEELRVFIIWYETRYTKYPDLKDHIFSWYFSGAHSFPTVLYIQEDGELRHQPISGIVTPFNSGDEWIDIFEFIKYFQ